MSIKHAPTLSIETVTTSRTASGHLVSHNVAIQGIPAQYRIARRQNQAYKLGLAFVKSLAVGTHPSRVDGEPAPPRLGITYVAVLDSQCRVLAAWRAFDLGMTGTHDRHPMVGGRPASYRK